MRNLLLFVLVAFSVFTNAQTTIKMEKDGGIYKVKCKVNGAPMKMYFDTGATVVSISRATAIYLYDNDLITKADFIGKTKTATADGAIVDNMVIRLKDVELGGLHLKNVEAVVSSSLNAPLLLGQSVISKLGKITLNGDILVIHSSNAQSLSKEERDELDNKLRVLRANRGIDEEANYKILDIIKKIEKSEELNEYELFCKLMSEGNEGNYDEAIVDAEQWLEKYALDTDSIDMKMRTYFISAKANILSERGDKELGMKHLNRCYSYFVNDTTARFFWYTLPNLQYEYDTYKDNGYTSAINAAKSSINYFLKLNKVSLHDINNNKCHEATLQNGFFYLQLCYSGHYFWQNNMFGTRWKNSQIQKVKIALILAAKVGDSFAIEQCQQQDFDYKRVLTQKELEFVGIDNY